MSTEQTLIIFSAVEDFYAVAIRLMFVNYSKWERNLLIERLDSYIKGNKR